MSVRAKLHLTAITDQEYGGKSFKFVTWYDTSIPEDQRFESATPSGELNINVTNPAVIEQFHLGDDFYVDFNKVEKVPAA